jgi:hypothetical protein
MTKQFDNTNRGALFKNIDKEQPTHCDYRGDLNVNGEEFWLSAWLKESKAGTKYLSISVRPKQEEKTTAKAGSA